MTDNARTEVFARIRHACAGNSGNEIERELRSIGSAPAAALPSTDLCTAFLANVLKNQGTVACAHTRSEAVKTIGHYIYQHYRSYRLVAGNDPHLAAMPWRDGGVLPRFGVIEPGEQVTLSYARLAVAEMGAVVTFTGKNNPAANNLLAEHHIVLVDSKDLVDNLESAWQRINQELGTSGRPRGINFIAGPSSTADVEGQLVYGAHGPRAWHVILMGDDISPGALDEARSLAGQ